MRSRRARASASPVGDDRHAGARRRPRRAGAQPRDAWPAFARDARRRACGRTRRRTSARRSRACRCDAGAVGVCVQKVARGRGARRGRRDRHLHQQRGRSTRPSCARVAALAGRVAARRSRSIRRSASQRLARALTARRQHVRRVRRDRRRPGPLRRRAGRGRRARAPASSRTACASPACRPITARAQHLRAPAEREAAIHHAVRLARAAQASIVAAGIACPLVTGAGTGTFVLEAASRRLRRAAGRQLRLHGPRLRRQRAAPSAPRFEHALFVKTQVMSRGVAHAVVDAGHKSHAIDSGPAARLAARPRLRQRRRRARHPAAARRRVRRRAAGARRDGLARARATAIRPSTCTSATSSSAAGSSDGVVDAIWPIEARGCVQ